MKTIAWRTVGDLIAIVHSNLPMDPADVEGVLRALRQPSTKKVLVHAGGRAVLDARQRSELAAVVKDNDLRVVVLTDSAVQRGVVTALGWITGRHSSFSPGQLEEALEYLGASEAVTDALKEEMPRLFAEPLGQRAA